MKRKKVPTLAPEQVWDIASQVLAAASMYRSMTIMGNIKGRDKDALRAVAELFVAFQSGLQKFNEHQSERNQRFFVIRVLQPVITPVVNDIHEGHIKEGDARKKVLALCKPLCKQAGFKLTDAQLQMLVPTRKETSCEGVGPALALDLRIAKLLGLRGKKPKTDDVEDQRKTNTQVGNLRRGGMQGGWQVRSNDDPWPDPRGPIDFDQLTEILTEIFGVEPERAKSALIALGMDEKLWGL